jgi:hypothetical protein
MSKKDIDVLKSFAEDFTKILGVPCQLVGESGMFSIAEMGGPNGSIKRSLTQSYDAKTLYKVCVDYIRSFTYQMDRGMPVEVGDVNTPTSKIEIGRWDMPHYIGNISIGAQCKLVFKNDPESILDRYISFGQHNETTDKDQFGINDEDIFFYAHEGEGQLKALMQDSNEEFIVKSYTLSYPEGMEAIEDSFDYVMEITDQRKSNGQLFVDVGAIEGNMDDLLSTTFEINKIPGTEITTQCMHLNFNGDAPAVSIFKKGDSYIIRPEQGVTIMPIRLEDGSFGYVLE